MSMYPGHRGMGGAPPANGGRLNELFEQIRQEFESQVRQTQDYEHQGELPVRSIPYWQLTICR